MVRRWPLCVIVALLPLLGGAPCALDPVEYSDAGAGDGGTDGDGGVTARDVTFAGQPAGEWSGGTIDGVDLAVGLWQGDRTVQVIDYFGSGQDLQLACGTLTVKPPENHAAFALIFNDDQGPLLVDILDHTLTAFTDTPINTITDAQAVGITSVDGTYKKLTAAAASTSRPIGALVIASCTGYVHEVVLE